MATTVKKQYLVVDNNSDENFEISALSPEAALEAVVDELWCYGEPEEGDGATVWTSPVEFYVLESPRKIIWRRNTPIKKAT